MNTIELLILNIAFVIFLKDNLNLSDKIKVKMGYDLSKHVKPFDCYFCLIGWTTIITALFTFNLFLLPLGYLIAIVIDGIKRI